MKGECRGAILLQLLLVTPALTAEDVLQPTNLLYIMYDDLRPELSIYGREHMITPNFERLAKRSVVFDYAFCQVAVCNPSRDSMLTGLRPDTTHIYGFQASFRPHMIWPTHLVRSGYNTAGYGKILHWDGADKNVWNYDSWENNWYEYQGSEGAKYMNSSVMPDDVRPEEWFRDFQFTDRVIKAMHELVPKVNAATKKPENFMVGVGFKLPHLAVHVPWKYYEMYRNRTEAFKLNHRELRFPPSTPEASYRIGENVFTFMSDEGRKKSTNSVMIGNINEAVKDQMRLELMWTYCAAVTFLDVQLGRILDIMDEKNLWENTTVILTADHGMHNGEKGIWEKWTLFDESTRVPLMISHPNSPFQGGRYNSPVELLDLYPTIMDLVAPPFDEKINVCDHGDTCLPVQGKSLANVILGDDQADRIEEIYIKRSRGLRPDRVPVETSKKRRQRRNNGESFDRPEWVQLGIINNTEIYDLRRNFAISQTWRCGNRAQIMKAIERHKQFVDVADAMHYQRNSALWTACDQVNVQPQTLKNEITAMGYTMRTPYFRYVVWVEFDKYHMKPVHLMNSSSFMLDEELYDHRKEMLGDFTHREVVNVARKEEYWPNLLRLRERMFEFLSKEVVYSTVCRDLQHKDLEIIPCPNI